MRSIIKNMTGFSMPEIMVALGLMGGISLVTMKIVEDQKSNEAYLKGLTEIQKTIALVKSTLNNPTNCRGVLSGKNMSTDEALANIAVPLTEHVGQSKILLEANTTYKGFKTESIFVTDDNAPPNSAVVVLNFRIKSKNMKLWGTASDNSASDRIITQRIPILVTETSGVISECGPIVSDTNLSAKEQFCDSLGGAATWDTVTEKCVYNDLRCPLGEVLIRLTSLGGKVCGRIKDQLDLYDLFDESFCTISGNYRMVEVGGKFRIDCL